MYVLGEYILGKDFRARMNIKRKAVAVKSDGTSVPRTARRDVELSECWRGC